MNRTLNIMSVSAVLAVFFVGVVSASPPTLPTNLAASTSQWGIQNLNVYSQYGTNCYGCYSQVTGQNFASSGTGFNFLSDASNPAGISMRTVYFLYGVQGKSANLSGSTSLSATFAVTNPENIVGAHGNAYVRLFFQSSLPSTDTSSPSTASCAGSGYNPDNFWWSTNAYYFTGSSSTGGTLIGTTWSNLCGQTSITDPTGFANALAHVRSIGFAFSSGSGYAHGLWAADGAPTPTFTVSSYTISTT